MRRMCAHAERKWCWSQFQISLGYCMECDTLHLKAPGRFENGLWGVSCCEFTIVGINGADGGGWRESA